MIRKVKIPEFYIALVLADDDVDAPCPPPRQDHLEALRQPTIDFLIPRLKKSYPSMTPNLELQFQPIQYLSQKPEPRFQVYWEVQATACFNTSSKVHHSMPKPQDVFDRIGTALDGAYVLQVVRAVDKDSSPLANAVEVEVRCVKKNTPGGSVQVPAFYMGFVCSNETTDNPTDKEKELLLQLTHAEMVKHLQKEFNGDFESLTIKIVKTEIGTRAGKPDATYNLYVEFEAIATFAQNAPDPMDLFRVLTKCISTAYMGGLHDMGGLFDLIVNLTIRLCVWVEIPELVLVEGVGGVPIIVIVHVEFFVALVIKLLQGLPNKTQLDHFDALITEFFSQLLAATCGADKFVDLVLSSDAIFQAGRPLPRFNMLYQFQATIRFVSPPPSPMALLNKIVNCNVAALLDHINNKGTSSGSSAGWVKTSEVTLGRGFAKPPVDHAYGGKIDILPKETDAPPETPPIVEKAQIKRKPNSPPKKTPPPTQKTRAIVPAAPPVFEPAPIVASGGVRVRISDIYVAFTIMDCDASPTREDYSALVESTKSFYAAHLQKRFGDNFQDIDLSVREALFNSAKPSDRYNVYVAWEIETTFANAETAPQRHELCQSLVYFVDLLQYLKEYARTLSRTPFSNATGIYSKLAVSEE
jgi:hypothetical protein